MRNLTNFIKHLYKNGNAKMVGNYEAFLKDYPSGFEIAFDESGKIKIYDLVITDNEKNTFVKKEKFLNDEEKNISIGYFFKYLLVSDFNNFDFTISSDEKHEFTINVESMRIIDSIIYNLFQVSSHDISWALSSNDRYFYKIFNKALAKEKSDVSLSIDDIEEAENKLIECVEYIKSLEASLKGETTLMKQKNVSEEWINAYDNREPIYSLKVNGK